MAKVKTSFFCQNCGAQAPKWTGRCPSCGQWNTFVEEVIQRSEDTPVWKKNDGAKKKVAQAQLLNDVAIKDEHRIAVPDQEMNRVLGGGLVPGSLILMGGEPGIGKSTLLLQIALSMKKQSVLYISGEESEQQIKMRADRLKLSSSSFFILTETSLENIFQQISAMQPQMLIIDSIQTIFSNK